MSPAVDQRISDLARQINATAALLRSSPPIRPFVPCMFYSIKPGAVESDRRKNIAIAPPGTAVPEIAAHFGPNMLELDAGDDRIEPKCRLPPDTWRAVPICNLYTQRKSAAEIAAFFGAGSPAQTNASGEIFPGYPGLVVAAGEVRTMTWGFPLALKSKKTGLPLKPKPVNNAREDKLATAFWRDSFAMRRCLIPVTAWAEAEGAKGRMTRTWYSLPGEDIFAVAGIWRATAEWGDAYSMVMVDGCAQMAEVHDRMPTILARENWARWTQGSSEEAMALCRVWEGPLQVMRTQESWTKAREGHAARPTR